MAPKKAAASPTKGGSPMKGKPVEDPAEKIKAYKSYFSTLDVEQLRTMCKEWGLDSKGTKAELVDRLSNPKKSRARSGSPVGRVSAHFSNMTKEQEWKFFGKVAALLGLLLVLALLFHSAGGDFHKFLDFFGDVGQKLKGIFGMTKGAAKTAAAAAGAGAGAATGKKA